MSELPPAVTAVRNALPTSRHAGLLCDAVAAQLGEGAWIETAGQGSWRRLFRREDGEWLVPWPLLSLRLGGRMSFVTDWMNVGTGETAPPAPAPAQREVRLRGIGPAELEFRDGACELTITYGENGQVLETSRSAELGGLAALVPQAGEAPGSEVERLAVRVCALPVQDRGPARVRMPAPLPSGVQGVWHCARRALRRALFAGQVPGDASWIAADGIAGTAVAHGTSRETVLSRWLRTALRVKPSRPASDGAKPPVPLPPPGEARQLPDGSMILSGPPAGDVPWPSLLPEDLPVAAVELRPLPAAPPPVGRWLRVLGERGATALAALRRDDDGFTVIGEAALASLELQDLDERMDAAAEAIESRLPAMEWPADRPPLRWSVHAFRVDEGGLRCEALGQVTEWDGRDLDGDRVAGQVVRCRRIG